MILGVCKRCNDEDKIREKDQLCASCVCSLREMFKRRNSLEFRNKEKEKMRRWRLKNPEKNSMYSKKEYQKNKWKVQVRSYTNLHCRQDILKKFNNQCDICGSKQNLEIDHEQYVKDKKILIETTKVLCRSCHRNKHMVHY